MQHRSRVVQVHAMSYPPDPLRLAGTIETLRGFTDVLRDKYGMDAQSFDILDLESTSPALAGFLTHVIKSCVRDRGCLASGWLCEVLRVLQDPTADMVRVATCSVGFEYQFVWPHIERAASQAGLLQPVPGGLFVAVQGVRPAEGGGPWGECIGEYPLSVVIERTGMPESMFHEFLHQFGVSKRGRPALVVVLSDHLKTSLAVRPLSARSRSPRYGTKRSALSWPDSL